MSKKYNEFLELYMEKTGLDYEVADVLAKRHYNRIQSGGGIQEEIDKILSEIAEIKARQEAESHGISSAIDNIKFELNSKLGDHLIVNGQLIHKDTKELKINPPINDTSLSFLKYLPKLKILMLLNNNKSDAFWTDYNYLDYLNLKILRIDFPKKTVEILEFLKNQKELETLVISSPSDINLKGIEACINLNLLNINAKINDITPLYNLNNLKIIYLNEIRQKVDPEFIKFLFKNFNKLEKLQLNGKYYDLSNIE
jgi:hypothetical protein